MSEPFKHALVTGGAGFVGSHLAHALLAHGLQVTVLDDLSTGLRANVPPRAGFVFGDIRDTTALDRALDGADIVFHQAAKVRIRASVEHLAGDADVNVMGTIALLQAMERAKTVRRMVLASSMAVYADSAAPVVMSEDFDKTPLSPYGTGKLATELFSVQTGSALGIDVVPLRYFNIYGPGQGFTPYVGVVTIFATQLMKGLRPVIFGDGRQTRDFVHVSDIVAANLAAMDRGIHGRSYNIGSGRGLSVNDIARVLTGKIAPGIEPEYGPLHRIETRNSIADIALARRDLGYAPGGVFERDVDAVIAAIGGRVIEAAE